MQQQTALLQGRKTPDGKRQGVFVVLLVVSHFAFVSPKPLKGLC
jgi:hypothetical protein